MTSSLKSLTITRDQVLAEIERRKRNRLLYWWKDNRTSYAKHMQFFADGLKYRERAMMAGNRIGKSEGGAYEVACHLTGIYPDWWEGRRFDYPINALVAGETGKLVRDSMQAKLLGPATAIGTGMIPAHCIIDKKSKSGIPDAVDLVTVRHISGKTSLLQFQSYDQGREAFQATERDVIWLDEEPPLDVYSECLIRTMTTGGIVLSTFTPLKGVSETVLSLQAKAEAGTASITIATWDDAPHLGEKEKAEMLAALPPHQRDARSKGVPALGSGAVFQVPESDILCDPFVIPPHFRRLYGLDVGWNNTAACWGAYDPDTDIIYITGDYKRGQCEPAVHASAIRARGAWMTGAIDPASRGRSQHDGEQLIWLYQQQGLNLVLADNAVESGIFAVYERLATGRVKIFRTCTALMEEYRLYRRDDKGRIVKQNDHIMDAMRYMAMSITAIGKPESEAINALKPPPAQHYGRGSANSWMN